MAQTTPPNIDPVPTPPIQRGDRATFSARVDAFILWLVAAVAQFRAVALNVYNNAVDAFNSATSANTSKVDAQTAKTAAETAKTAAETARTGAETARTGAETAQTAAQGSATAAANSATALTATSTTSNTVSAGTKTFTIQSGKQFVPGVNVKAVDSTNAARAIYGTVDSYTGTSLQGTFTTFEGSGTVASWNISVIGQRGQQGPIGTGRVFTETNITASGSWTTDAEDFDVYLQAPGSGGKQLFGGSSGGYVKKTFRGVPIGTVCTYLQGATGIGTTGDNANGTDGGNSTFTVPGFGTLTAGGGKLQGWVNGSTISSRAGGTASGGDVNLPGQIGDDYSLHTYVGNPTVNFPRKGGNGADSPMGQGGVAVVPLGGPVNAYPPVGYGAGGAGGSEDATSSTVTRNASNGAPGVLRIIR